MESRPGTPPPSASPNKQVQSTPVKTGTRTIYRYAENYRGITDYQLGLADEMSTYILGPMPADSFLSEFLPSKLLYNDSEPTPSFTKKMFRDVVGQGEATMYPAFVAALNPYLSNVKIYCTAFKEERARTKLPFKIKADCSVFPRGHISRGTDSSAVELIIEFKRNRDDDPFPTKTPSGSSSNDTTTPPRNMFIKPSRDDQTTFGQMIAYCTSQMSAQYRTHIFSVLICGDHARLIRWDRGGIIVTEPIRYDEEPHLFDFFIRFDRSPCHVRGHDSSVRPANPAEIDVATSAVRELEEVDRSRTPLLVVSVPNATTGKDSQYVVASPIPSPWAPIGRWTRTSIGFDLERKQRIFMKDSWRPVVQGVLKEGDVYLRFKTNQVPNVPHCSNAGDIGDDKYHSTQTYYFLDANWTTNNVYDLPPQRHYRLILDDIGQPLDRFNRSRDMVRAVHAALIAHRSAYKCGILHRDISPGNILITSDEKFNGGLLIDWDLCKDMESQVDSPRRATRTGTWQFLAADLILDSTIEHTFVHDLESALYVIFWLSIKFLRTSWNAERCAFVMRDLFNPAAFEKEGATSKRNWMANSNAETQNFLINGNTPLTTLITTLLSYFQARHVSKSNQSVTRATFSKLPIKSLLDDDAVQQMARVFVDHEAVLDVFEVSLGEQWPMEDPATRQHIRTEKGVRSSWKRSCGSEGSSSKRLRIR